ncbi:DnaD domain-containing protein [Aquibacillus sediminis]|uniref:DnaD domain-containing protein n=1 Tax=Aquibacillus sediminis TaxID=2574734 RepID=UPI001107D9C1|nr:DnaD domain protein [Aquibacillus sediminis]
MNYIEETKAFYDRLEYTNLSRPAILLWHAMMQVKLKAGWKKQFTATETVLCAKSQINAGTFKKARAELEKEGFILFLPRGGNLCPNYQMISLVTTEDQLTYHNHDNNTPNNRTTPDPTPTEVQLEGQKNDDKQEHKPTPLKGSKDFVVSSGNSFSTTTESETFYLENIEADLPPYMQTELHTWVNKLSDEIVMEAMKRALEQNKANWAFVKGILKKWEESNFTTVAQIEENEKAFREKQRQKFRNKQHAKQEVIPDWFESKDKKPKPQEVKAIDQDKEKQQAKTLLKDYLASKKTGR